MRFEHPQLLWFLLLAGPGLGAFLIWAWIKKRRLILQFVQSRLLAQLTVGVSAARQKTRLFLLALATSLLTLALARPQVGFDWEEARQRGLDIVVAIDTSRSMLAEDLSPSRLTRAKLAALDLKKAARTDRLGLIAFAGSAFLQCPLSLDDEAFRQSVEALDVNIIPQGGTALAEAIRAAIAAFKDKTENYKVLVLFTDGEDHDGQALEAARAAAEAKLRIFTVGVGTPNGELLRTVDTQGRTEYIKDDQGQVVKSRLNETLLREIAQAAHGFYIALGGVNTIDLLYERGLAPLPKAEFSARTLQRFHERFQWPLALAILVLLSEMLLPERKRVRRAARSDDLLAKPDLRRVATLALALLWPALASASTSDALNKYHAGRYASALLEYERALEKKPDDPRLQFNAGAAAFQARDYELAQKYFNSAMVTQDLGLQQRAYYNLGNTHYRLGEQNTDPTQRQETWQRAVTDYESALKLAPNDGDAQYNLDFVRKKLEELQQQQQQQDDQNKENQQENKEDQQDPSKQDQSQEQSQQDQKKQHEQQDQKPQEQKPDQRQQPKEDQQQQQPQPQEQPKPQQSRPNQAQQKQPSDPSNEAPGSAQPAGTMQMTPEQARQLLDTLRSEERPLIFVPPNLKQPRERRFKNW